MVAQSYQLSMVVPTRDLSQLLTVEHAMEPKDRVGPDLLRLAFSDGAAGFLAESGDGEPLGYAMWAYRSTDPAGLVRVAVVPRWRRRGIGRSLVDRVLHTCAKAKVAQVVASVLETSPIERMRFLAAAGGKPELVRAGREGQLDWVRFTFATKLPRAIRAAQLYPLS